MVKSRRIDGVHDEITGVLLRDYGKMMLRSSRTGRYRVRGLALRRLRLWASGRGCRVAGLGFRV